MASRIFFPLVFLALLSFAVADGLLSLDSSEGFNNLRRCAYNCYNGGRPDGSLVADKIDCGKPGVVYVAPDNDCFCRPDLQETAVRYLSNCAYTSCSQNELDVSSATQVYKDYCSSAGYTAAAPKSVDAQPTGETVESATDSSSPTRNTGAPTSDEPADNSSSSSGLSVGAIVGIVAGVISAVAAVIGCIIKYMSYKKQKNQARQEQGQQWHGQQWQGQEQQWQGQQGHWKN